MKAYTAIYTGKASRDIKKLSPTHKEKVEEIIKKLCAEPRPDGCVKLSGEDNQYRYDFKLDQPYRIVYSIADKQLRIEILRVRPRKDVYTKRHK